MATLTINTTAQDNARIVTAFGRHLGLTNEQGAYRDATGAEVKAAIVQFIVSTVRNVERDVAALPAPVSPT